MKSTKRSHPDFRAAELKLNEDSKYPHTVYFKEHSVRDHTHDKPSGRTLFVVNIPPYADDKGLVNAFQEAGTVQSVQLCLKPNTVELSKEQFTPATETPSFRVAYLIFSKVVELDKALKLTELHPMNSDKHKILTGMSKWVNQYNSSILTQTSLKEKVENFMKKHDEKTKEVISKEKDLEQEDDEGWVTVTKRGKVQSFARSEKVEDKIMQKEEKNKKRKELKNFYTFQIRESKMKHIVTLRQKFEEDKRKIAQIKQSRRFKPF